MKIWPLPQNTSSAQFSQPTTLQDTFSGWYETHQGQLRRHIARLLSPRSSLLIDDLIQETFLKTWRRLVTTGPIDEQENAVAVRNYLYRVATNLCIDVAKRGKLIIFQPLSGDPFLGKGNEEDVSDQYEDPGAEHPFLLIEQLESLNKLRGDQREALLLFAHGYSYEEIAGQLHLQEVKMFLARARKALQRSQTEPPITPGRLRAPGRRRGR